MNFLIVNQHTQNFGDDFAGCALIENLLSNYKNCIINLIYNTPGTLPIDNSNVKHNRDITFKNIGIVPLIKYFVFGKKSVNNPTLNKFLNIIDNSDYIFVSPCGANIGIYKDWQFLVRLIMVIKEKKTPIFYLNTIGKSDSYIFNTISKYVLKKSRIYVREKKSQNYLKSIKIESKFGSDTAFSHDISLKIKKQNKLTFVPTELNWHPLFKNYDISSILFNNIIKEIAEFSLDNNLEIHLLPHLNSKKELEFYDKVKNRFLDFKVDNVIIDKPNNYMDYYENIATSKYVIGMRYHTIVASIKSNVPFISLSYENKMNEVCTYSNMLDYSIKLYEKEYSNEIFHKILNNIKGNSNEIVNILKKENYVLKNMALQPLNEVKGYKNEK